MTTTNNIKIKFLTETAEGKAGSQSFGDVATDASDENIAAALQILSSMQTFTVTGYQKTVTSDLTA